MSRNRAETGVKSCIETLQPLAAKGDSDSAGQERGETKTAAQRHVDMTWAQRLKRVFKIDIET